jgi:hypothetical protein
MSLFKRRHPRNPNRAEDEPDTDEEHQEDIDPQLRLRTVRTAASSIAEAGRIDDRTQRRKSRRKRGFFGRGSLKHKGKDDADAKAAQAAAEQVAAAAAAAPIEVPGLRRNVYVNVPLASDEVDPKDKGEPLARYKRNKVRTTSMCTPLSHSTYASMDSDLCIQSTLSSRLSPRTCMSSLVGSPIYSFWVP